MRSCARETSGEIGENIWKGNVELTQLLISVIRDLVTIEGEEGAEGGEGEGKEEQRDSC